MSDDPAPAVADLRWVCQVALARAGVLLTAGELVVVERILALEGAAALLYARLTTRVHDTYPVAALAGPGLTDVRSAADALVAAGLTDHLVPWPVRAARSTRAMLVEGCRRLGLRRSGRRAELEERLRDRTGWSEERWLRTRHRGLVRRLERWAFLRPTPDRATLVVARREVIRWPEYPITSGAALHPDRRALRSWEQLLIEGVLPFDKVLEQLARGAHRAPGRLDLTRRWRRRLHEHGHALERQAETTAARTVYEHGRRLLGDDGALALRISRTLEVEGRARDALEVLVDARAGAAPEHAHAFARSGRRLARRCRRAWVPTRPLRKPTRRLLYLTSTAGRGSRPLYRVAGHDLTVEPATQATLAEHGRIALHTEGSLWTTLFALLFADCYFLAIPGALPVRFLSAPLDLGSPAFRARRAAEVEAVLDAVDAGETAVRVAAADTRWRGTALAGARWDRCGRAALIAVAETVPRSALRAILERLLDEGWRAARGMPDLVVLPGDAVRLDAAHPRQLPRGPLLAELKGPTDAVRDAQAVWFDRLVRAGAPVELWEVRPRPRSTERMG